MNEASATPPPELETITIDVDGEIGTLTLNRPRS
jgi:enoyl-CoA hydratase/carnithine racemase